MLACKRIMCVFFDVFTCDNIFTLGDFKLAYLATGISDAVVWRPRHYGDIGIWECGEETS